jgi:hypothetical protein
VVGAVVAIEGARESVTVVEIELEEEKGISTVEVVGEAGAGAGVVEGVAVVVAVEVRSEKADESITAEQPATAPVVETTAAAAATRGEAT